MLSSYDRTGLPAQQLKDMMEDELWMTAEEAVSYGFADDITFDVDQALTDAETILNDIENDNVQDAYYIGGDDVLVLDVASDQVDAVYLPMPSGLPGRPRSARPQT